MGYYVHLSVVFACDANEGVAGLAASYRASMKTEDESKDGIPEEAAQFLEDLAKRTGSNPGPKGGLSMWGIIGNHTSGREFVESLKPFWSDLLAGRAGRDGPCAFEHVIVFCEPEEKGATAFEISIRQGIELQEGETPDLVIEEHSCPFKWNQQ